MALLQQEAVDLMKKVLGINNNIDQPDYARGLIQAIVEVYEENGVNMVPILQDALSDAIEREE